MTHAIYILLNKLDEESLSYTLSRHRSDTILVSVTFIGLRAEIDVFEDGRMEVCCFRGSEAVEGGEEFIYKLIEDSAGRS